MGKAIMRRPNGTHKLKFPKHGDAFKFGLFKAANIELQEAAINNSILRVRVARNVNSNLSRSKPVSATNKQHKKRLNNGHFTPKKTETATQSSNNTPESDRVKQNKDTSRVVKTYFNRRKYSHNATVGTPQKVDWSKCRQKSDQFSRVNLNFDTLAANLGTMSLPSPAWKINVMINENKSPIFKFTCDFPQKSVIFTRNSVYYEIVIGGSSVLLLGSPETVESLRDVEILLDVVDTVSLKDCMVALL